MDEELTLLGIIILLFMIGTISIAWPPNAPWVPTGRRRVRKILKLANVQPGDVVYDLGSGDGRVILMAAREFGARSVGIEIDPLRYLWTQMMIFLFGISGQVRVIRGDIFRQNLSEATVLTCYLLQETNDKLLEKLEKELRPGTRIVSHTFTFPTWTRAGQDKEENLYLYRIES